MIAASVQMAQPETLIFKRFLFDENTHVQT